jgi:hypothetical protein
MAEMISDNQLLDFPEEPELAFVHFESLERARLNEMRCSQQDVAQHELDYMSNVLGAAKAYEVHELCDFELPDGGNDQWILDACRKFRVKAQHIAVQLRIKSTRRLQQYSVKFDGVAKEKLRHHLNQMRTLVDKAELPQGKKDRLASRINALGNEIDRDRTRYEVLAALAMEASDDLAGIADRLAPSLANVVGIFRNSKEAEQEKRQLPAPQTPRQIEAPKRQVATQKKKNSFDKSLDDEIPF